MADRNETIKLLKECDAGVHMGISSLEDVIKDIPAGELRTLLEKSRTRHQQLKDEITGYLIEYGEEGKEPGIIATAMAKMKENMKMMTEKTEQAAAKVIIDGCDMGVKSIHKYYNQYPNAEEKVKKIAEKIEKEEEKLGKDLLMRIFL